jgi:hypothetical protein
VSSPIEVLLSHNDLRQNERLGRHPKLVSEPHYNHWLAHKKIAIPLMMVPNLLIHLAASRSLSKECMFFAKSVFWFCC